MTERVCRQSPARRDEPQRRCIPKCVSLFVGNWIANHCLVLLQKRWFARELRAGGHEYNWRVCSMVACDVFNEQLTKKLKLGLIAESLWARKLNPALSSFVTFELQARWTSNNGGSRLSSIVLVKNGRIAISRAYFILPASPDTRILHKNLSTRSFSKLHRNCSPVCESTLPHRDQSSHLPPPDPVLR